MVRWSHGCSWKAIASTFLDFSSHTRFVVVMGQKFVSGKICGGEINYVFTLLRFYRVIIMKNLTISTILGNPFSLSWNLNFYHNLIDLEIENLKRLMSSLTFMHLSPSVTVTRAWSLSSLGLFLVKSFFLALSNLSNPIPFFPTNFFMEINGPIKVQGLYLISGTQEGKHQ